MRELLNKKVIRSERLGWLVIAISMTSCAGVSDNGAVHRSPVYAEKQMVSAANPHATRAGLEILRSGGGAVDAAIAVQMVLTLVEPQASGIGGGGFLLHFSPPDQGDSNASMSAYDGRETAPSNSDESLFLDKKGKPLSWDQRKIGGRSVGVPGILKMLELAHAQHGKVAWEKLFQPAIKLAREGFLVSPRLHKMIRNDKFLFSFPGARKFYYLPNGSPLPVGYRLKNLELADLLERIAKRGTDAFYRGIMAEKIARAVRETHHLPGQIMSEDIETYAAKRREILCNPYRIWIICGMPPPTSGGIAVIQILKLLERFDMDRLKPNTAQAVHLITEASRLAFADRNQYLGDPDFIKISTRKLVDESYLSSRSALISVSNSMGKAEAGEIDLVIGQNSLIPDEGDQRPVSTSHISIVDQWGEAISMTTSVGTPFGSRIMVSGFILNDQLADFAPNPRDQSGNWRANRPGPGKRPRSSMSPTLVLDKKRNLVMAVGSPGGSNIIGYVAKTLIGVLDWKLDMQAAIDLPNFTNKNDRTELEKGSSLAKLRKDLRSLGHNIRLRTKTSGLHGIRVTLRGLEGGADTRREGIVLGD
jgi:gamma-glutamyltranspeptidase/glutathione hydrolase